MDRRTPDRCYKDLFIIIYLLLNLNFSNNVLIVHDEVILHYKKTSLQVTVITGIIISLSEHHLQGCRCRILPPAFFKYKNCKIAYRPKVPATLCSGLDMGMSAPLPVWKRIINFEVGGGTDLRMVALVFFVR
jgi:hypothetical protein